MKYSKKKNLDELTKNELTQLGGGFWWQAALLAIAYNEFTRIWDSGGQNLIDAYNAGYEAGPSGSNE